MNADSVTWVVGAGGLLGRHVVGTLKVGDGRVVTRRVPWGDPAGTQAALADGLDTLCNLARDGRWNIVWCAGAGVVATSPDTMEAELAVFEAFLADLEGRPVAATNGCFFLASSAGGVYAASEDPPFTEDPEPHPLVSYGAVKLAMEDALATLSRSTGMRALIGRIANLYGPGQKIDKRQGLVSQLCSSRVTGQPVSIYVPFDTLRDYLLAADCADMVVAGLVRLRRRRADDDPVVVKVIASGRSISVGGLIGETRRVLRTRPRVLLRASSSASGQARDLRLRSVVWPELQRFARTPLPVGYRCDSGRYPAAAESQHGRRPMRLLVTGGAGFIGSHYVRTVLGDAWGDSSPELVIVLDRLTYAGNLANLADVRDDRLDFVEGDILDHVLVDELMARADAVVHFAAESHVDRSILGGVDFVMTNVVGTQTLLDSALRHEIDRFVHVSTDEVYGSITEGSWDEDEPLRPNSPYSASKASSDLMVRAYHRTHGLPACVTRSSNNYGPYQFPEKLIPFFVTNLLDGRTAPLYGEGLNVRDWLHVDDHCRGIHMVLGGGRPGEVYNIGGGNKMTNRELTQRLLDACGASWDRVEMVTDRPGHDLRYSVEMGKIRRDLGYEPRVDFDTGLAETIGWYTHHRDWWEPLKRRAQPTP